MADAVIAVFAHHHAADVAVRRLVAAGFDRRTLSVIGRGCQTRGEAIAVHGTGERIRFWGPRGAFWGDLWGLFFGGLFLTFPGFGIIIVLGYLAATTALVIENEAVADGFGLLGSLLSSIGVPADSVGRYEAAVQAEGFLVMAHGSDEDVARAKTILGGANPLMLDVHSGLLSPAPNRGWSTAQIGSVEPMFPDRLTDLLNEIKGTRQMMPPRRTSRDSIVFDPSLSALPREHPNVSKPTA